MILSFAWTTPAVVIREKTETRRDWTEKTVKQFAGAAYCGAIVSAYDRSPRFGGKCFGRIRILELIHPEDSKDIPDEAWTAEGFHILELLGAKIGKSSPEDVWRFWKTQNDQPQTVVKFELLELNSYGEQLAHQAIQRLYDLRVTKIRRVPPGFDV